MATRNAVAGTKSHEPWDTEFALMIEHKAPEHLQVLCEGDPDRLAAIAEKAEDDPPIGEAFFAVVADLPSEAHRGLLGSLLARVLADAPSAERMRILRSVQEHIQPHLSTHGSREELFNNLTKLGIVVA